MKKSRKRGLRNPEIDWQENPDGSFEGGALGHSFVAVRNRDARSSGMTFLLIHFPPLSKGSKDVGTHEVLDADAARTMALALVKGNGSYPNQQPQELRF